MMETENMMAPNMELIDISAPPPNFGPNFSPKFNLNQSLPFQKPYFRPNFAQPMPPQGQMFVQKGQIGPMTLEDFDGKRLRKSVMRKTVDYNSSIIHALETRIWQRDFRDRRALQPEVMYYPELLPPPSYPDNPINCVTTRFVKTATNKMRCPIFCMAWTPEGRRLVTGASSGEFTLWNGLTFNFETILQAHDSPVRTMVWSHNDNWMVTGDHSGYVKYWQSNMNNVKMFQAHKEAIRGLSFSPTDSKFVTCSDDGTLRIWDFYSCCEEHVLRGHGADVKCVEWHPQKGLIISGSKDNQQPIKLWDPKTGQSLATLHAHKSTVMDLQWNNNGNWLITASRDHLLKLFDLRNLNQEVQTFRGHKKEASSVAWHPCHEGLFASGGSDGSILFWHVGADKEVGGIEQAHDSIVWTLAWHPLGHILCSGSNDHSSKFWTRNRPGDLMRDKYNLNTLPPGLADDMDADEFSMIPGMGPEDKVEITSATFISSDSDQQIPGLDLDTPILLIEEKIKPKKVPYSKPIPKVFQAHWNDSSIEDAGDKKSEKSGAVPLKKLAPNAIIISGQVIPVETGSELEKKIADGPEALREYILSGAIEQLSDIINGPDGPPEDFGINFVQNEPTPVSQLPSLLTINPNDVITNMPIQTNELSGKHRRHNLNSGSNAKRRIGRFDDNERNDDSRSPTGSLDEDLRHGSFNQNNMSNSRFDRDSRDYNSYDDDRNNYDDDYRNKDSKDDFDWRNNGSSNNFGNSNFNIPNNSQNSSFSSGGPNKFAPPYSVPSGNSYGNGSNGPISLLNANFLPPPSFNADKNFNSSNDWNDDQGMPSNRIRRGGGRGRGMRGSGLKRGGINKNKRI